MNNGSNIHNEYAKVLRENENLTRMNIGYRNRLLDLNRKIMELEKNLKEKECKNCKEGVNESISKT
ncbi:MAG: hypothetical protein CL779_03530 [Chloroflexi bacterium]|nr:hypothetical protein [Chloroflexota bacterium]